MTSKAKAIEVITHNDAQNSLYLLEITADLNVFNDNQIILSNYISQQRTQPTIDDAIKVVEDIKEYFIEHDRWVECIEDGYPVELRNKQYDILTALKRLKGE